MQSITLVDVTATPYRTLLTLLQEHLRDAPKKQRTEIAYRTLAELARYDQISVSLDDPRYAAAMRNLAREEQRRKADFSLTDLDGKKWTLREQEIPALNLAYDRFKGQGLIVLAISEEDPAILRKFVAENGVQFPVLPDAGAKERKTHITRSVFRLASSTTDPVRSWRRLCPFQRWSDCLRNSRELVCDRFGKNQATLRCYSRPF